MKKVILLLTTLLAIGQNALAYDFSYTYQGQTLYYNIISGNAQVTKQSVYVEYNYSSLSGNVSIPASVTYGGTTYSVTSIDHRTFEDCDGITSVTIPNTITQIGNLAFGFCSGLTSVSFNADSCTNAGYDNGIYHNSAFYDCPNITSFSFGNNVKVIPSVLCYGLSGITSVTIPNSVVRIGQDAFKNCSGLINVDFNADSCTYAGSTGSNYFIAAFINCPNITSFNFGNNVKAIPENLCYGLSGLASITIPRAVTSIGYHAFYGCSGLVSVTFNADSCNLLSSFYCAPTFVNCPNLTSFTFGNNVKVIPGNLCMNLSSLTSVNIPDSVISIGAYAFYNCSGMTSVTIGNGVTVISAYAFYNCSGMTSVTIPNSVTSIGNYAFSGCSGLTSITCNAVIPPTVANANAFYNVSRSIPLRVPIASVSSYQSASVWNEFTNCIGIGGYIITATSANPTMGTVSGGGRYATGATATLTATPNMGYHFVQWQDGNTQNPRTITVTGDATYTATFAADAAPATVTATISQIAATSAYAEIVMGQQTSYFYLIYAPQSVFTQNGLTTDEAIISYINQHYGSSDRNYSNVSGYMNDLTPNTTYQLVVVPYNSNGEVGMVCWEQFTTLNETDPATVTATISEVTATSAYAEIVMGQQTSYFYLIYAPQSVFTQNGLTTDESIITYVNQNYGSSDRNYNNVSGYMNDLTPNTTYILVVVPYNSNDEVGTITRKQFTTLNNNGIEDVGEEEYAISSQGGRLTVSGAEGNMVNVYSLDGRCIYSASAKGTTVIDIPASGTYLLKIGHHPARKVVVIR
ncbi:MAG: leucine-rich repeat domain-containing protein [Bacteroidales bacterium]|nr:leucine-rich repeat domain-containing protein [Bacteroidales bacterium]